MLQLTRAFWEDDVLKKLGKPMEVGHRLTKSCGPWGAMWGLVMQAPWSVPGMNPQMLQLF